MTPLLTAEDLAPLLGLSADQVRKLAREGIIPQHRIGGAIRFDYEAVKMATGPRYTATGMDKEGCQRWLDYFQTAVVSGWDTEGDEGNEYKIAHFDGVTALARDLGLIDHKECEQRRDAIRGEVGYEFRRLAYPSNALKHFENELRKLEADYWDEAARIDALYLILNSADRAKASGHLKPSDHDRLRTQTEDIYGKWCELKRPVVERLDA